MARPSPAAPFSTSAAPTRPPSTAGRHAARSRARRHSRRRRNWRSRAARAGISETGYDDPDGDPTADAQQRRRVRRGSRDGHESRVSERRRRRRAQRGVRDRSRAALLGGGVSAQPVGRGRRRHQGELQRRQGHQGAERFPGTERSVRTGAGDACRRQHFTDRSGEKPRLGRRTRAGIRRQARTGRGSATTTTISRICSSS